MIGFLVASSALAFTPGVPLRADLTAMRSALHVRPACAIEMSANKFKKTPADAAAAKVVAAAGKFGSAQKDAAKMWVEQATSKGEVDADSLLKTQLTLFEECLVDDDDGGAKVRGARAITSSRRAHIHAFTIRNSYAITVDPRSARSSTLRSPRSSTCSSSRRRRPSPAPIRASSSRRAASTAPPLGCARQPPSSAPSRRRVRTSGSSRRAAARPAASLRACWSSRPPSSLSASSRRAAAPRNASSLRRPSQRCESHWERRRPHLPLRLPPRLPSRRHRPPPPPSRKCPPPRLLRLRRRLHLRLHLQPNPPRLCPRE